MRKFIFALLLLVSAGTAAQAQISAETGLSMANLSFTAPNTSVSTSMKPGATFGLVADMRFGTHIYFEPAVFYDMAGCKFSTPAGTYSISRMNIPVNIEYKSGIRCGNRLMVGVGLFFGNILAASYSKKVSGTEKDSTVVYKIGSDNTSDIKQLDLGFGFNIGYQLKQKFYFRASYQKGLANLYPNGGTDYSIKSSNIGLTVGYVFIRCKPRKGQDPFRIQERDHWRGLSKGKYSRRLKYGW